MQALRVLAIAVIALAVSPARAQGTRVAVVSGSKLYDAGGIARWLAARGQLDGEKGKFKVVESPTGKKPEPLLEMCKRPQEDWQKRFCAEQAQREHERATVSEWEKHEHEVLDPIEADIQKALEQFAKARGIELLLDRDELAGGVVFATASVDITDAFVKDYNARTKKR